MNVQIIAKSILLLLLLLFERVVGLPIVSAYLFFGFIDSLILWKKIVFVMLFSIVLSSFYGLPIVYVFVIVAAGNMILSLGFFRKQRMARIALVGVCSLLLFWYFGVSITRVVLVYSLVQMGGLVLSQFKRVQFNQ